METPFFRHLIHSLGGLNWADLVQAHRDVEALLGGLRSRRDLLRREFQSHSLAQRRMTARSSREPSTHYKWHIHIDADSRFEVWLHEYKPTRLLRPGYAVVAHNHVYWFSSLILSGGFTQTIYDVKRSPQSAQHYESVNVTEEKQVRKDDIYTLNSDTVHSLGNIQEGTLTLIVNSKAVRPFSEEFNLENKTVVVHDPLLMRVEGAYPFLDLI